MIFFLTAFVYRNDQLYGPLPNGKVVLVCRTRRSGTGRKGATSAQTPSIPAENGKIGSNPIIFLIF